MSEIKKSTDLDFISDCLIQAMMSKRHNVVSKLFKVYEEIRESEVSSESSLGNYIDLIFSNDDRDDDRLSIDYSPEMT